MTPQTTSPRFFNPIALWADVALKTSEMLVSAGSVIQIRTQRMATAGLQPSAEDQAEFQLMGQEKLEAAAQSGTAIANHLTTVNTSLMARAMQHWFASAAALVALSTSITPAQAMGHLQRFIDNIMHSAATVSQLSSATARIAQRGLKPIHAKATSNARRLALGQA